MVNMASDSSESIRLAQLQHALAIAASVPDPSHPDVQKYLTELVTADPEDISGES